MKKHSIERKLLASVLSLVLCCAMLIGMTFAWFRTSVESGTNVIKTAKFDAQVFWSEGFTAPETSTAAAADPEWINLKDTIPFIDLQYMPGSETVRYFVFYNNSDFTVKFDLSLKEIVCADELKNDLTVYESTTVGETALTPAGMTAVGTVATVIGAADADGVSGVLSTGVPANSYKVVAVALQLPDSYDTIGEYEATFKVIVVASQYNLAVETQTATAGQPTQFTVYDTPAGNGSVTNVTFEEDALAADSEYKLEADTKGLIESSSANFSITGTPTSADPGVTPGESTVAAIDLKLFKDESLVSSFADNKTVKIETYITKGLTGVGVVYNGTGAQPTDVTYDPATGKLTFKTSHFSEYVVVANETAYVKATDTVYANLQAALTAVGDSGTITMIGDEKIVGNAGIEIGTGKDITIDLNGCTIDGAANEAKTSQLFSVKGKLTIADTSAAQRGTLTNSGLSDEQAGNWWSDPQRNYANNVITNRGTFVLESGNIVKGLTGNICYAIDSAAGNQVIINGGTVEGTGTTIRIVCGFTGANTAYFTINGGHVKGTYTAVWVQLPSKTGTTGCEFVVNGGVLEGGSYSFYDYSYGQSYENVNYTISGGKLEGSVWSYGANSFTISGGEINGDVISGGPITYTGGTVSGEVKQNYVKLNVWYGDGYVESAVNGEDYYLDTEIDLSGKIITAQYYGGPEEYIDSSMITVEGTVIKIDKSAIHPFTNGQFCIWIAVEDPE